MSELPPVAFEEEPEHRHGYRRDIADWWCYDCQNVTDFCRQLNDFGQEVPSEEVE